MRYTKELLVARRAAQAASKIILRYYGKKFKIRHKGEINLVTEVDEKAQRAILQVIRKSFPRDAILAEELDLSKTKRAPRRWIIDPIDGTTNFAHGYPRFCVSIAFEAAGKIECGVIYDPVMKEEFTAERKRGARLNGKTIRVSGVKDLKQALLVTGFPYDLKAKHTNNMPYFLHLISKAQAIRRDGSAALNLAYVACGRFDGFWELGLSAWDVAVGVLLIEEAGGWVRHIAGGRYSVEQHALIAGPRPIAQRLIRECRRLPSSVKRATQV
jgi:myo-inositol-1(or 4)-monophosphatase